MSGGPAPETSPPISAVGEQAVLDVLAARWGQRPDLPVGPGDDAAVLAVPDGRMVATTDLLVENRHFRRDWSSWFDIGRRAAAQNFADLLAMGARPTALLLGLSAPGTCTLADLAELADGLHAECLRAGAVVAGGDLVRDDHVTLAVTALGVLDGRAPVLRSGAEPGQQVVLCGRAGWSAAGLALLSAGRPDVPEVVDAFRCPELPYADAAGLVAPNVSAMCDVSDGLLSDLGSIASASGVSIELDLAALVPDARVRAAAALLERDPMTWVLTGGEDHGLVACLSDGTAVPSGTRRIGRVVARVHGKPVLAGGYEDVTPGWDSFRSDSGGPGRP